MKNIKYFPKTSRIKSEVQQLGARKAKELYEVRDLVELINNTYQAEYLEYVKNEEYFPGCPLHIYKKHYQSRIEKYFLIYPGADKEEYYFLESEDQMINILLQLDNENENNFYSFYSHLKYDPHKINLNLSIQKTREFIDNRIYELGHTFYAPGFEDPMDIPLNLPREYWEPMKSWEAKENKTYSPITEIKSNGEAVLDPDKQVSLKWLKKNDLSELDKIHKALKDAGFIDCDLWRFKRIFLNQKEYTPIDWIRNDTALFYFYDLLIETNKIKKPKYKWKALRGVFNYSSTSEPQILSKIKNGYVDSSEKFFFDSLIS